MMIPTMTTMVPSDSGRWCDKPRWNTFHGSTPRFARTINAIANAKSSSPMNKLAKRSGTRPAANCWRGDRLVRLMG